MPSAVAVLASIPSTRTDVQEVESVLIGLPSDIPSASRSNVCIQALQDTEARLRDAQCRDALQDLRDRLHTREQLFKYKKLHVRHQGANTRTQTILSNHQASIQRAADKYRRARQAKLSLVGLGEWEQTFAVLHDKDIRAVHEDNPNAVRKRKHDKHNLPAEGHRVMSWIWRSSDKSGAAGLVESLRVEWCKARARAMRWEEEEHLLPEEMRRVLAFLEWQEAQWLARIERRPDVDPALQQGLTAYALDQALIRRQMRGVFCNVWIQTAKQAQGGSGSTLR